MDNNVLLVAQVVMLIARNYVAMVILIPQAPQTSNVIHQLLLEALMKLHAFLLVHFVEMELLIMMEIQVVGIS